MQTTTTNKDERELTISMIMLPEHANPFGNVHGGEIMKIMDNTAGCTATRFTKLPIVTARVDALEFLAPVHIGSFVECTGRVVYAGTTSVEVHITLDVENLKVPGSKRRALEAFFTLVALGEDGKPTRVPGFTPETKEEKAMWERVKRRRDRRRKK